jgi:hypothetical protein
MSSPYAGVVEGPQWLDVTRELIAEHPLRLAELKESCLAVWDRLWRTTVGEPPLSVNLAALEVPASVVGYFFEVLLARELATRCPEVWRGNQSKEEKDLVCLPTPRASIEIKTSGQLGDKVYGNRSHGQKAENESLVKKEKSGYYLTVNFFGQTLTLIRFGWIDSDDWVPQGAPTGQMAALKPAVYQYKLIVIPGAYRRYGPVRLLAGVGPKAAAELAGCGIRTIGDFIDKQGALPTRLANILTANREFVQGCADRPIR